MKIVAFSLIVLFGCVPLWGQSTVKISGTVTVRQSGKPLAGANVVVVGSGFGTTTDEKGRFVLENLLVGVYSLQASFIGYESEKVDNVVVTPDQPAEVSFRLKPAIIQLAGVAVTARKMRKDATKNVVTVTRKQIERSNYRQVAEILQTVPGIDIQTSGGVGGSKKITIRGSEANQVLVLLNGVPLNDQLTGGSDISLIPVNQIERIEIYKGGNSTRFGNGAIGGVLNIITRKIVDNKFHFNSTAGSFRMVQLEPGWSGHFRNFAALLSYNYSMSAGNYPYKYETPDHKIISEERGNADSRSGNIFFRLNYRSGGHLFSLQGQEFNSDRGLPGKINYWTAYARVKSERKNWGADYRFDRENMQFFMSVKKSRSVTENSNLWPADAELRYRRIPRYHYLNTVQITTAQTQLTYFAGRGTKYNIGLGVKDLIFNDENLISLLNSPIGTARDRTNSGFISREWTRKLSRLKSELTLFSSLRYDHIRIAAGAEARPEKQWSPGVGVLLASGVQNRIYLKSNFSKSFRMPTFADLFYQDFRVSGKPDLLPEKSKNSEISIGGRLKIRGELRAEISAFQNTVSNLIVWRLGNFQTFSPYNTDAVITGQEYSFDFQPSDQWFFFSFGFTKLNPVNKSKRRTIRDKILPYRPQNSVKIGFRIDYKKLRVLLNYRYAGKRYVTESNTIAIPGYQVLDGHLSQQLRFYSLELLLKFSVFNLTDQRYEILEDMPLPPREWRVGIAMKM